MKRKGAAGICTLLVRVGLFVVLLLGVQPAIAQISFEDNATHRQELKYGLQEAREVESVYKDTHLNLDNRNFKKGEVARKQVKIKGERTYYRNNRSNNAVQGNNRNKFLRLKNKSKP